MTDDPALPSAPPPPAASNDGLASVVSIDKRDDIAAICGRIDGAPTFAVVVHAPRGNRQAASQLGMRRIARHAEDSGRAIAIATRSRSLTSRARQEGVPVGRKPDRIRWDAGGKRVLWLGPFSLALPSLGRYAQAAIVLLLLVAVGLAALAVAPSADITVSPPMDEVSQSTVLTGSESITEPQFSEEEGSGLEAALFPAEETTTRRSVTLARATTGVGSVPVGRATVLVTMTNNTSEEVVIPEGTIALSNPDSFEFIVDQETTVPAGESAIQQVSSRAPGPQGNVPAGSITSWQDPRYESIAVTNAEAAVGGTTENRTIVSADDVAALQELALTLETGEQFKSALVVDRPNWGIFQRTIVVTAVPGSPSPGIGQPATFVLLEVTLDIAGLGIRPDVLDTIGRQLIGERDSGELVPGSVRAVETGRHQVDSEEGYGSEFVVTAGFSALTEDDIKSAVTGKTEDDAIAALASEHGIEDAEIDLFPSFVPWLPRFNFRIDVTFAVPVEEPPDSAESAEEAPEPETDTTPTQTPGP